MRQIRIGYLVPEFPGQTHIFFWRELQFLATLGIECDLVSTRSPPRKIMSHTWSEAATQRTTYLSALRKDLVAGGVLAILKAGPVAWWRTVKAIANAAVDKPTQRLRLVGLALTSAPLVALARSRGWAHLHVHSCADSAHLAMFSRLLGGVPYSLMLHGPLEDYGPNQSMKWRHASFGIVITQKLLTELRATLKDDAPEDVAIAPMGVDIDKFARSSAYSPWCGQGSLWIYACGRLNVCKGHDDLIKAVAILRGLGIDARLRIAGADDSSGRYQHELEVLIKQLHLQEAVELLGAISEEQVRRGLEQAHIFALASLHEPLGVAIMEAMAMELPVVVTGAGGVAELINDGVEGLLVRPRNPEEMARALERVARNPAFAASLTAPARAKVITGFQSDRSARALAQRVCKNCAA
jgi:colanic acid/amylovoran biosynthesis glycosyltransferase